MDISIPLLWWLIAPISSVLALVLAAGTGAAGGALACTVDTAMDFDTATGQGTEPGTGTLPGRIYTDPTGTRRVSERLLREPGSRTTPGHQENAPTTFMRTAKEMCTAKQIKAGRSEPRKAGNPGKPRLCKTSGSRPGTGAPSRCNGKVGSVVTAPARILTGVTSQGNGATREPRAITGHGATPEAGVAAAGGNFAT